VPNLLIIYPHWYPSNLAGVHRARLTGNYLSEVGWQPFILAVKEQFYEEKPDPDFYKLFSPVFIEYRVDAFNVSSPRLIGDIGLRAFFQLYRKAKQIIKQHPIDFIWIPIPSFYIALLGRFLYHSTKVPYGIDYIDPWVRDISNRKTLRNKLSNALAYILEPIAVKKSSLITGVSEGYYMPMLKRNFKYYRNDGKAENDHLKAPEPKDSTSEGFELRTSSLRNDAPRHVSFPYGFDPNDYKVEPANVKLPWSDIPNCKPVVYAGAFLPNSVFFTDLLFKQLRILKDGGQFDENICFFFIGTGAYQHTSVQSLAAKYELHNVIEIRDRFPYTHILFFLQQAYRVLIIGSTEEHYTASKLFQGLLSKNPVFAIFHQKSSAHNVLKSVEADTYYIPYHEDQDWVVLNKRIKKTWIEFLDSDARWQPKLEHLNAYSARELARQLSQAMEAILEKKKTN
jgi:hypothetical protein